MYLIWTLAVFLIFYLITIIRGPSVWDRLLGMNLLSIKIVMIIAVFASNSSLTYLLDFAIIYALFGFIGVIFIALFLLERTKNKKAEE